MAETRRVFVKRIGLTVFAAGAGRLPAGQKESATPTKPAGRPVSPQALHLLEPSYEQAVARWPDMLRPIAFLGCKDHTDEFAVMWNGNLSLQTCLLCQADRHLFQGREDDSLEVSFSIGEKPEFERYLEDDSTEPSLAEGYLPVTQVRLRKTGAVLLQEAFVCDEKGNGQAATPSTAAFLWVRFVVEQPGAGSAPIGLWAQVAKNHISYSMETRRNVRIERVAPLYGRELRLSGNHLLDSQGMVRMAADQSFQFHRQLPDSFNSIALSEFQLDKNVCEFRLPHRAGAVLELVFPFVPVSAEKVNSIHGIGYSSASVSVRNFWQGEIARGMQVEVPPQAINDLWRFSVPLGFMTADTYPNGDHVLKLSSHHYEAIWSTGMALHLPEMILRGYQEETSAFLDLLLDPERRRPVPNSGTSYDSTEGFISGPSEYIAIGWVPDHGAIMWTASQYYLVTRDQRFLDRWLPTLLQGLEWIAKERAQTKAQGQLGAGLMPPGRATDLDSQRLFIFNDAWTYRGLAGMCQVLSAIHHKDADRWERERDDYRATFQKAFRNAADKTIRWRDASGVQIPFVPWELTQTNADNLHVFYLDGGPLFAGVAGLVDPDDETMTWGLKWLTEGPDSKHYNPDYSDFSDRPSLPYEMASSEPALSWNIPLRFLRNERLKFLEGFYSLCAGAVSRKFLGGHETRDGIQYMALVNATINLWLRNMLIFEDEREQGLHLLRNSPGAWIGEGNEIRVENAQTFFGPMGYTVRSLDERRVQVDIRPPSREPLKWLRLHLYHATGNPLQSASVTGLPAALKDGHIVEIKNPQGLVNIIATF
jgi:hypothetical protein